MQLSLVLHLFGTLAGRAGPSVFITLESQPQIILFYYFFGGCGFKSVTGQCGARRGICSTARLGRFSLNPSATNMKWIYPAFKFNNGLMPQSGSAWHNAPVKRKEAGATQSCHIKPILEKWIRQICLFGVVQCHVSLKVLHMFRLEFIQND